MRKIKRIEALIVLFCLSFYNSCFADALWLDSKTGEWREGGSTFINIEPASSKIKPINYILIGILVLVIVTCAIIIIRKIIKKKKEKSNDNK